MSWQTAGRLVLAAIRKARCDLALLGGAAALAAAASAFGGKPSKALEGLLLAQVCTAVADNLDEPDPGGLAGEVAYLLSASSPSQALGKNSAFGGNAAMLSALQSCASRLAGFLGSGNGGSAEASQELALFKALLQRLIRETCGDSLLEAEPWRTPHWASPSATLLYLVARRTPADPSGADAGLWPRTRAALMRKIGSLDIPGGFHVAGGGIRAVGRWRRASHGAGDRSKQQLRIDQPDSYVQGFGKRKSTEGALGHSPPRARAELHGFGDLPALHDLSLSLFSPRPATAEGAPGQPKFETHKLPNVPAGPSFRAAAEALALGAGLHRLANRGSVAPRMSARPTAEDESSPSSSAVGRPSLSLSPPLSPRRPHGAHPDRGRAPPGALAAALHKAQAADQAGGPDSDSGPGSPGSPRRAGGGGGGAAGEAKRGGTAGLGLHVGSDADPNSPRRVPTLGERMRLPAARLAAAAVAHPNSPAESPRALELRVGDGAASSAAGSPPATASPRRRASAGSRPGALATARALGFMPVKAAEDEPGPLLLLGVADPQSPRQQPEGKRRPSAGAGGGHSGAEALKMVMAAAAAARPAAAAPEELAVVAQGRRASGVTSKPSTAPHGAAGGAGSPPISPRARASRILLHDSSAGDFHREVSEASLPHAQLEASASSSQLLFDAHEPQLRKGPVGSVRRRRLSTEPAAHRPGTAGASAGSSAFSSPPRSASPQKASRSTSPPSPPAKKPVELEGPDAIFIRDLRAALQYSELGAARIREMRAAKPLALLRRGGHSESQESLHKALHGREAQVLELRKLIRKLEQGPGSPRHWERHHPQPPPPTRPQPPYLATAERPPRVLMTDRPAVERVVRRPAKPSRLHVVADGHLVIGPPSSCSQELTVGGSLRAMGTLRDHLEVHAWGWDYKDLRDREPPPMEVPDVPLLPPWALDGRSVPMD